MRYERLFAFAFAVSTALAWQPGQAAVIELRADTWCPFNCDPDTDRPGFMVEIAREALAPYGHQVNYRTMNWARSLEFVRAGRIDGVIGTDADEGPDLIFGPPLATYREATAFRRGEARELTHEAIEGLRVGVIAEYEYSSEAIISYIDEHGGDGALVQMLSGEMALAQNLRKLSAHRIDLVPEDNAVLRYTLANMGMQDAVDLVLDEEVSELYIAFSPARETSQLYAEQLTEGVERLRQSGRLAEILARYGLTE